MLHTKKKKNDISENNLKRYVQDGTFMLQDMDTFQRFQSPFDLFRRIKKECFSNHTISAHSHPKGNPVLWDLCYESSSLEIIPQPLFYSVAHEKTETMGH